MDVQAATIRPDRSADLKQSVVALVVPVCLAAITLGATAAGLLLWRRLSGAISLPVPEPVLAATGIVMAGYLVVLRATWFGIVRDDWQRAGLLSRADYCVISTATLSIIAVAASLSIPGTRATGLLLLWTFPLGVELAMAIWAYRSSSRWDSRSSLSPQQPSQPLSSADEPPAEIPADDRSLRFDPPHEPPSPHWPDDNVSQQLTRRRTAEGVDSMHLWVRAEVPAGARVGVAHLAFCPPFDDTPEVLFEQADGPEATLKLGQVLPYGARLEWKLASVATIDQSVLIEVFVQETSAASL